MAMNRLSKQAEQRLTEALEKVASLVSEGEHPNDAIVKVATESGIPAGHVNLMVNAFNTGRTETQRKIGQDIFEKAAEFDIADAEDILKRMFPQEVKTASDVRTESVISDEYRLPPTWHTRLTKKAELNQTLPPLETRNGKVVTSVEPLPADPVLAMKKAYCQTKDLAREVENRRGEVANLQDTLLDTITKLAEYFRRPGCEPFPSVKKNMTRLFDKQAEALFKMLESRNGRLTKQASSDREQLSLVNFQQEPYNLVKECLNLAENLLAKKAAFESFEKQSKAQMEERILPFGHVQDPAKTHGVLESVEKKSFLKIDNPLGPAYNKAQSAIYEDIVGGEIFNKDKAEQKALKSLQDPKHLAKLRNMQTSSLLTDLMANDDIISSYQPDEVIHHYNEISQIAPRASSQEGVVRAILRKRLAGGQSAIDPYDVTQLLDIENKIKERDTDPYKRKAL